MLANSTTARSPNFSDADYQLAAYAAALCAFSLQYSAQLKDIDIRSASWPESADTGHGQPHGRRSSQDAVRTASNVLRPRGPTRMHLSLWLHLVR